MHTVVDVAVSALACPYTRALTWGRHGQEITTVFTGCMAACDDYRTLLNIGVKKHGLAIICSHLPQTTWPSWR